MELRSASVNELWYNYSMTKIAYIHTKLDPETDILRVWTLLDDGSSIARDLQLSTEDGQATLVWSKAYTKDELPSEWLREMSEQA